MRIDLQQGPQQAPETSGSSGQSSSNAVAARNSVGLGQDHALFSGTHVQVQALAALAAQLPEVRAEKVQALRESVHNGTYKAQPNEIAGALVNEMVFRADA